MNFGILTTLHEPLLPFYLKSLENITEIKTFVIIANVNRQTKQKDLELYKERTDNYFSSDKVSFKKENAFRFFFVNNHNSELTRRIIKKKKIKYLFNGGTPSKINMNLINLCKGVINIHPGILPNYAGCNCVEWALLHNDPVGITAHLMDKNYDSGPIISKKYVNLSLCKTYEDVRISVYLETIKMMRYVAIQILKNKINLKPQKEFTNFFKILSSSRLKILKSKILNKTLKFNQKNIF
jgi:hypothetical protein